MVVPQFDVIVGFNVHLNAPVICILDADNLGGNGVVETIAEGEVVSTFLGAERFAQEEHARPEKP